MRENMGLYRGKRIDNGEWVEGFYVRLHDSKGHESHRIYSGYAETDCGDYYPDWYEVDPETIGECSGLPDRNGGRIFEGDILQSGNIKGAVKYSNKRVAFGFKWRRFTFHGGDFFKECNLSDFGEFSRLVVIGNIHDNPELVEVRE